MKNQSAWLTRSEVLTRLAIGEFAMDKLVGSGRLGVLQIPGLKHRKFSAADVDALLAAGTRPATVPAESRALATV